MLRQAQNERGLGLDRTGILSLLLALAAAVLASSAQAHPAPFSYLDLDYREGAIEGRLTVHAVDIAQELGLDDPEHVLHSEVLLPNEERLAALLFDRIELVGEERLRPELTAILPLAENDAAALTFRIAQAPAGALSVDTDLFPYDPQHQSFVNLYEGGELRQQWIFNSESAPKTYYPGTTAGVLAVMGTFIPSGIHHILIGPDHLLFILGLMLLSGSLGTLVRIVTAFTVGHSVTLALAVLDIVNIPASVVEPAIALTIVVVGADNLLRGGGRDLRAWMAFAFGLVHGFGFAGVLREFGLPQEALGWSLFSFNVGVELGQLAVVVPLAFALAWLKSRSPAWYTRVVTGGSIAIIGAGAFWFVQRVFLTGGIG